ALEIVRDWIGDFMNGIGNVKSWTPYWKEVLVRRPGNILATFRFRQGGPVEVSQTHGWSVTEAERAELEKELVPLLDELGRAMTQRLVADGIQSVHPEATRSVRPDDSILMQMQIGMNNQTEAKHKTQPQNIVVIIRPDMTVQFFVRCDDETLGRKTIRRLVAELQVAGLPLTMTKVVARSQ
ncbi:MAG: hypothetical protein JXA42_19155, partial [Anaerolineales bacterium]|nr:hypothetical protein [Anaerolineales bacterium]